MRGKRSGREVERNNGKRGIEKEGRGTKEEYRKRKEEREEK